MKNIGFINNLKSKIATISTLGVLIGCTSIVGVQNIQAADFSKAQADALYIENCASCHGADRGGFIGPALTIEKYAQMPESAVSAMIAYGVEHTLMPPWNNRLTQKEIDSLAKLIKNYPKEDLKWDERDIQHSLIVHVADESKLPKKPTYKIKSTKNLMAVVGRGTYSNGKESKVVFFNEKNQKVGEVITRDAPHVVNFDPKNERWAYIKSDGGRVFKVDLYSMQVVRSIKVGYTGPSLAVSFDGKYIAAGSFVPNTAVILDAKTLMPVKYLKLEGMDLDGKYVQSDSGSITATPYNNHFAFALENSGQVWLVDTSKESLPVTKIKNVGRHLHDAMLTPDGKKLIIAAYDDDKLAVIDFNKKKKIKDIKAGCQPHTGSGAITKIGSRWVGFGTNIGSGSDCKKDVVTAFDAKTFEVIKQIKVSGATESPAAHPKAPYIAVDIVSNKGVDDGKIDFIDKKTLKVAKTIDVGGHSHFPEYTADGKYLYVSSGYAGNKLVILDSKTLKIVKTLKMEVPAGIFSAARPHNVVVGN